MARGKKKGAGGRMDGRRVILTGAASGIGRATAALLAEEGARLALLDISAEALQQVAGEVGALALPADLADPEATVDAVESAAGQLGGIDGVINCAGISGSTPLEELELDAWQRMLAINLTAPYLVCRAALPWLRRAGAATIVNVASGQALLPNTPGISAYAASKGGLLTFTKALAAELAPSIRANVVCPGIVDTPMVSSVLGAYDNPDDAPFVRQYALQRVARPEEIARTILFLSCADSAYVTGAALAVDGGRTFH